MAASNMSSFASIILVACGIFFGKAYGLVLARNESAVELGGEWTQWSDFGLCSVSCGLGSQSRTRACMKMAATNTSSITCSGDASECQQCSLGPCPVNGGWSEWSDFGECPVSCGGSSQFRTRNCNNPSPFNGGMNCSGITLESRACNIQPCPVHGGWSDWSCYSICTKDCGTGVQHRNRSCTNPAPSYGGVYCVGNASVERPCNENPCKVGSARDCHDIRKSVNGSGVFEITPASNDTFKVWCNMEKEVGWTVIQRRMDGSVDFYRVWNDYKHGFGNPSGEYWIGLDRLHLLTSKPKRLRVRLEAWDGEWRYAEYSTIFVDNESNKYQLKISGYNGTAGDSLNYHNGMYFSTMDRDNDNRDSSSCSQEYSGAWWYNSCYYSNLNGRYGHGSSSDPKGNIWHTWKGSNYRYKQVLMEISDV